MYIDTVCSGCPDRHSTRKDKRKHMKKLITVLHGFCMALADSVPGVSGGTIAFLMGFYDKFIGSLNALISGTKAERIDALKYLVKLGIGWRSASALPFWFWRMSLSPRSTGSLPCSSALSSLRFR